MRECPLAEVAQKEIGELIPSFSGRVLRVQDQNSGENNYGPWTIQNIEVADRQNRDLKVKVKVFDGPEIPKSWVNREVEVISGAGDKGQLQGVAVAAGYQGRGKCVEVKYNLGAFVEMMQGGRPAPAQNQAPQQRQNASAPARNQPANAPQGGSARPQSQPRTQNAPQSQPARQDPPVNSQSRDPKPPKTREEMEAGYRAAVKDARQLIARKLNGYKICLRAARALAKEEDDAKHPITEEHIQKLTATLYIAGDKAYKWDALPIGDFEKYLNAPAEQSNNEPPAK
jgi:hypothetical protein